MPKSRILIVYTGGTIGMRTSDRGYEPVDGFADLLSRRLQGRTLTPLPDYDLIELETLIDSANVSPGDWRMMADIIIKHHAKYDGFVILHGTDTMAYSASALSFLLLGLNKPVIFTGAQIPLIELRNDAFSNIVTSLILAAKPEIREVCVYFNGRIMRGNRCRKLKSNGFDAFDTPNYSWLGTVGINIDINDSLLMPAINAEFHDKPFEDNAVSMFKLYPGIDGQVFRGLLDVSELKALIVLSYGVGNPPNSNKSLIDFLSDAINKGVVVVNVSQCIEGSVHQGSYETGHTFNKIGVVPGKDLTLEAAFTKLHFLISRGYGPEDIGRELLVPYCGECQHS